jgi:hypothetical protein
MNAKAALLEMQFRLNMNRINGLMQLLFSDDALTPPTLFGNSSGARADVLRSIVVFLHATFEVALRSHIPKPGRSLSFYSRKDLDKALKFSGIDATPFQFLYPPLTQMAKRRHRIVHEADLSSSEPSDWSIVDDWQLIMWLLAVPTFYYQLRISLGAANNVERAKHERLRTAIARHVAFGNQLLAFPTVPQEMKLQAFQEIGVALKTILSTLHPDPRAPTADRS